MWANRCVLVVLKLQMLGETGVKILPNLRVVEEQ